MMGAWGYLFLAFRVYKPTNVGMCKAYKTSYASPLVTHAVNRRKRYFQTDILRNLRQTTAREEVRARIGVRIFAMMALCRPPADPVKLA